VALTQEEKYGVRLRGRGGGNGGVQSPDLGLPDEGGENANLGQRLTSSVGRRRVPKRGRCLRSHVRVWLTPQASHRAP